jgi:hypothetical protein
VLLAFSADQLEALEKTARKKMAALIERPWLSTEEQRRT